MGMKTHCSENNHFFEGVGILYVLTFKTNKNAPTLYPSKQKRIHRTNVRRTKKSMNKRFYRV